jgi:hypothetical protein
VYGVYWKPNRQSSVTQMDAGKPLAGQQDVTCESLPNGDYKNCKFAMPCFAVISILMGDGNGD